MRLLKTNPEIERCLPSIPKDTYDKLRESIREDYDYAHPIIVWKGRDIIVDGHNRYKICQELGKEPSIVEHPFKSTDEAILYALEHQENRRNLEPAQIALIGTRRLLLKEKTEAKNRKLAGTIADPSAKVGKASQNVASQLGIGRDAVEGAAIIIEAKEPMLEQMIMDKEMGIKGAKDFVKGTAKKERTMILRKGPIAVKREITAIRKRRKESRERESEEDAERKKELKKDPKRPFLFDIKDEKEQHARFLEMEKDIEEGYKKKIEQIDKICNGAESVCLPANVFEAWCKVCKWGFDIFKPYPPIMKTTICPYCGGKKIEKRSDIWSPMVD